MVIHNIKDQSQRTPIRLYIPSEFRHLCIT